VSGFVGAYMDVPCTLSLVPRTSSWSWSCLKRPELMAAVLIYKCHSVKVIR
jgi:hypothetical protein